MQCRRLVACEQLTLATASQQRRSGSRWHRQKRQPHPQFHGRLLLMQRRWLMGQGRWAVVVSHPKQ